MKKLLWVFFIVLVMTLPANAGQVGGVFLPDSLMAGNDSLILNGAGLRKKFIFKVYAGGLYLRQKESDPQKIIDADEPMAIRMHFIHDGVSSKKLVNAWNEGFVNGTGGKIESVKTEIEKFNAFFSEEAKKNDVYDIVYVPEQGTHVYIKGQLKGTIPGLAFKKAVFSIWLGEKPADSGLKQGMLGK